MATLKQKTAFKKMLENVSEGNPKTMGQVLVESGYGKISKQVSRVLDSKGFQELLATIDDKEITDRFVEIVRDEDKRASIQAGIELLKLKDRYPATKSKIIGLFEKIGELENGEDKTN
jgi:hypothetical protein